jgi:head-tail adaptor
MVSERLDAGRRNRHITLEQRTVADTADATSGEPLDAVWTTLVAAMPAARLGLVGMERFHSEQTRARFDDRWQINYRRDMDPELVDVPKLRRLSYQGRTFEIVAASVIGRRAGIELQTQAASGI